MSTPNAAISPARALATGAPHAASIMKGSDSIQDKEPESGKGVNDKDVHVTKQDGPRAPATAEGSYRGVGKYRRKKFALAISYVGTAYYGLQFDDRRIYPTIEGKMLDAIVTAPIHSKRDIKHPAELKTSRASRTDKGVHAACNVVSCNLDDRPDHVELFNKYLPPDVRVWASYRCTKSFQARKQSDTRDYEYLVPSYAFQPSKVVKGEEEGSFKKLEYRKSGYKVTPEDMDRYRAILANFVGTHRFHNYTTGGSFKEMTYQRHLRAVTAEGPVTLDDGNEWVIIKLKGQSFLFKMIRKIVGVFLAIARGDEDASLIARTFVTEKAGLPTAPPTGLLLDTVYFDHYNKAGLGPEPLDPSVPKVRQACDEFKRTMIYPEITRQEREGSAMELFLQALDQWPIDLENPTASKVWNAEDLPSDKTEGTTSPQTGTKRKADALAQ